MEQAQRAYIYRVFLALSPLIVLHGFVGADEINYWESAVGAVLAVPSGLATAFTPRKKKAKTA